MMPITRVNTVKTSIPLGTGRTYDLLGTRGDSAVNGFAALAALRDEATIPTVNGILTSTSTATVDPDTGATVPVNTANGRSVRIGNVTLPGAALLAQGASTGVFGALSGSSTLASNSAAAGDYPSVRTIVEDGTSGLHFASAATVAITDGVNYVISAYVKRGAGSRNVLLLLLGAGQSAGIHVDLSSGAITNSTSGAATVVRASARLLSTGFWLIQATVTNAAWGSSPQLTAWIRSAANTGVYTGDGVSSLIISGYDVIQADFARTPLAWDGSLGVSRVANLLSWNQGLDTTAGTIIALGMPWGRSGTVGGNAALYDGNNQGRTYYSPPTQDYRTDRLDTLASPNSIASALTPAVAGVQQSITQRWNTYNTQTINGVTIQFGSAATLPWILGSPIIVGNRTALTLPFDGHCFVAKWNRALTDAEVNLWIANTTILVP